VKARFEPPARAEFLQVVRWYTAEAGATVARRFEDEVRNAVQRLLENPMSGTAASHGLRRQLLHRFPYAIYYRLEQRILRIIAIAHQSRRPDYWSGRE
jgi:plasmid stabilization system protein ParE